MSKKHWMGILFGEMYGRQPEQYQAQYQQEPRVDPAYKYGVEYHKLCDAFDDANCTGPVRDRLVNELSIEMQCSPSDAAAAFHTAMRAAGDRQNRDRRTS